MHCLSLEKLVFEQRLKVKSSIVNTNSCLNRILSFFNSPHKELISGFRLVDTFSNCFSFNITGCKVNNYKTAHLQKLNNIFKDSLYDSKSIIVISDASIKNNAATSIAHIHSDQNIVAKTIHHTVNITSTEAELFAIRCGINQVIQVTDISCIIVITNAIHLVRCIFDLLSHPYQIQSIAIAQDLAVLITSRMFIFFQLIYYLLTVYAQYQQLQ